MLYLLLVFQASALTCPKVKCSTSELPQSTCVKFIADTYHIQPCEESKFCPFELDRTVECQEKPEQPQEKSWVGGACEVDSSCEHSSCVGGVCKGKALNETCYLHEECDLGLGCIENVCQPLLKESQIGCTTDFDCEMNLGCNATYGNRRGTCVEYFSLYYGTYVSDCSSSSNSLCSSGYCSKVGEYSQVGICKDAPWSNKRLPSKCESSDDCTGENSDSAVEGYCECGYDPEGSGFCAPLQGDYPGQQYLSVLKSIAYRTTNTLCNTARRFKYDCVEMIGDWLLEDYQLAEWTYLSYPKLQANDECVKRTINRWYYDLSGAEIIQYASVLLLIFNF